MSLPRAVLFDFGNTLLHEDYFDLAAGISRVLEFARGEVRLSAARVLDAFQDLNADLNRMRDRDHLEFTNANLQRALYAGLGLDIGLDPPAMEREFWRAAQRFTPAEGIRETLELLESRDIRTAIISNCPFSAEVMREELVKYRIERFFRFFLSSADYGFRKPHPLIFALALRQLDLPAGEVWFVGDHPQCDIQGAFDCGLVPVWYNPAGQSAGFNFPCRVIRRWREFPALLEAAGTNCGQNIC